MKPQPPVTRTFMSAPSLSDAARAASARPPGKQAAARGLERQRHWCPERGEGMYGAVTRSIHQLTPTLAWGDAIGNQVRLLRRWFQDEGYASELFSGQTDERSRGEARPAESLADQVRRGDLVLVHHGIQSRFVPLLRKVAKRAQVVVVYHNVTPPKLVEGFDPPLAAACAAGLEELKDLAHISALGLAFSEFSAGDLRAAGFARVEVVPFPLDFSPVEVAPDPSLAAELDDGCTNVLFVGRGSPNKRIDELLRVFTAYQRLYNRSSRLVIAGSVDRDKPYGGWVHGVNEVLSPDRVHILGRVSPSQLSACYATAHAYVSMSGHEGFGVPLIESMHHGVPVIAYEAGAVAETLGGAGWVCRSEDPIAFAKLLAVMDANPKLRAKLIERGRERVRDFAPERTRPAILDSLRVLLARAPSLRVVGGGR